MVFAGFGMHVPAAGLLILSPWIFVFFGFLSFEAFQIASQKVQVDDNLGDQLLS